MTLRPPHRLVLAAVLGLASLWLTSPLFAASAAEKKRDEVRGMRDTVLAELIKAEPLIEDKVKRAEGYAVFSNVGVNVVFASFAGGRGLVVDRKGRKETFMKMGSAGIGLGLGIKDFRALFVFYDRARLENFIISGWDFGAQADAAAKSDNKGGALAGAATAIPGVEVFQLTKNGVALQATLQGTKYWRDRDLN
jgi:lipid-binding SYLF domain-containing protein